MLAVVTNYYNPDGRSSKRENYERFLEGMRGLPLYVVEAAFGDQPFSLPLADNTLQVRCRDLIWQQYTLVNLVIRKLPDRFDKVAWVDADILFADPSWYDRLGAMLDEYKIVQSYKTVDLSKGNGGWDVRQSVAHVALENAKKPTATVMSGNLDLSSKYASGFSWGVQRELIERHGVYNFWMTGSCDTAFAIGIWGDWKNAFLQSRLNDRMRNHYLEWAVPFNEYVGGSVGCLDAHIDHLWHGHRNYRKRWRCLKDFDPYTDIRLNEGVLEWCSDKPEMHECCRKMCIDYEVDFNPYL